MTCHDKTRNGLTGVLVALQHHLSIASNWVPELNATILGATHDPLAIGREADAKNKVLRKTRLVWRFRENDR